MPREKPDAPAQEPRRLSNDELYRLAMGYNRRRIDYRATPKAWDTIKKLRKPGESLNACLNRLIIEHDK